MKALATAPSLLGGLREPTILVTGAHGRSGNELYAHVIVTEARGLSEEKLETIVAGQRPSDLTREEGIAYDMAAALVWAARSRTHLALCSTDVRQGGAELSHLIGLYCMVSVTLNTFDVQSAPQIGESSAE